ncbi:phosphodiester glycosidase family protein [Acetivibrio cellulolyticus]|uniref:phosphodiester glycosidase family protein n=1 Tax=Acetivibrio cellulolyticus TaxID=35830 RepID=UPI0001E2CC32|nr:phosphodiester glycosidase family protein [Acetivibrio cellulolyticus]
MTDRKKSIIAVTLIVSLVAIGLGHFLFNFYALNQKNGVEEPKTIKKEDSQLPVKYSHISTSINNNKQEIDMLEINLSTGKVEIAPALSHESLFGFEELSKIASKSKAYAAVNAGFFYEYGDPSGMVVIDGRILTKSSGNFPVFTVKGNKAELSKINTEIYMLHNGEKVKVSDINRIGKPGNIVLYTHDFGRDNRAAVSNTSVVIEGNKVIKVIKTIDPTPIPEKGMVLTFYEPYSYAYGEFPIKHGDSIEMVCKPEIEQGMQAYECGSWIVKDGKSVAPDRDDWVGLLTNRDPRTVVGIKKDGVVVLMTVDGRQPGYSIGVSAKELADILIDYGVKDAAMLDGGASTEMILKGKIVNKPSFDGKERPLGGALVVRVME